MKYIEKKKRCIQFHISTTFAMVGFCIFSFLLMPLYQAFQKDLLAGVQFLLIGFISISALFLENEKRSFSLSMSVYFFCYLFFYCAALFEFVNDRFQWYMFPSASEIIISNNIVLLGIICFIIGNQWYFKFSKVRNPVKIDKIRMWVIYLILVILTGYLFYLLSTMSIGEFFVRASFEKSNLSSQSLSLISDSFRNGAALICSLSLIRNFKMKKSFHHFLLMLYSLILSFFLIPPTGVARFLAGAFYGSLFLYSFPSLRKGKKFLFLMFFFILIIFPLLNNFRYVNNNNELEIFDIINGLNKNFQEADFDAYTMLIYTVRYVSDYGISFGRQFLGVILFFLPRTMWEGKPIGSGNTIVDYLLIPIHGNVSNPFLAEFYINFGFFGVIFCSILMGCLFKTIDKIYWNVSDEDEGFIKYFYPFLSLITIFFCRGDMLSSYSFTIGTLVAAYISFKCIYPKSKGMKSI